MPLHVSCDIGNSADYLAENDTWLDVYLYFQKFLRGVIIELAEVDISLICSILILSTLLLNLP